MKLSILIPAIGNQADIDETLISVLENRPSESEVLLAHPDSYVDPYQLDDEIRMVPSSGTGRLSLLNHGFSAARGKIVHTLCPGITVAAGWCELAINAFAEDANLGSLSPAIYERGGKTPVRGVGYRVGSGRSIVRQRDQRVLAPLIESGFYLRSAIQFMHGFDPQYADLADIELGIRMHSANYLSTTDAEIQLHSDSKLVAPKMHGFRAGQARGRLFRKAKEFGLASSQGWALLTEPTRNGFGLGIFTGAIGRIGCGASSDSHATLPIDRTIEETSSRQAA